MCSAPECAEGGDDRSALSKAYPEVHEGKQSDWCAGPTRLLADFSKLYFFLLIPGIHGFSRIFRAPLATS
jgi:hypothetical protein